MSDVASRCKVCGVWEQQSNPAEGCCNRCGSNVRKLHGYIHQIEAELNTVKVERNAWMAVANSRAKELDILNAEISGLKQRYEVAKGME